MPDPLSGKARGEGIKPDYNTARLRRLEGRKTPTHHGFHRKIRRTLEFLFEDFWSTQSGDGEGATLPANEVVTDEIPLIIDTTEMVGLHTTALGLWAVQLVIIKLHGHLLEYGLGQNIKNP